MKLGKRKAKIKAALLEKVRAERALAQQQTIHPVITPQPPPTVQTTIPEVVGGTDTDQNLYSGEDVAQAITSAVEDTLKTISPHLQHLSEEYGEFVVTFLEGLKEGISSGVSLGARVSTAPATSDLHTKVSDIEKDDKETSALLEENLKEAIDLLKKTQKQQQKLLDKSKFLELREKDKRPIGLDLGIRGKFGAFLRSLVDREFDGKTSFEEDYRKREEWVRIQEKLRPGTSRAELRRDYKQIQKKGAVVEKLERQRQEVLARGYSEEETEKFGQFDHKTQIILKSLMGKDARMPSNTGLQEEKTHETNLMMQRKKEEERKQTSLLANINTNIEALSKNLPTLLAAAVGAEAISRGIGLDDLPIIGGIFRKKKPPVPGKPGLLSRIGGAMRGLGSLALASPKIALGAAAVGAGALGIYQGYSHIRDAATREKAALAEIDAQQASGLLTQEQADKKRKEIATIAQQERGEGKGTIGGAAGGAVGGAKAGAKVGMFLGPKGALLGGLLGAGIGAIGGTALGGAAGRRVTEAMQSLGILSPQETATNYTGARQRDLSANLAREPEAASLTNTQREIAKEIGASIKIPAPVSTPYAAPEVKVVDTPFSQKLRNKELSVTSFIESRYGLAH